MNCPECGSSDISERGYSPTEKTDGQGYWWSATYEYSCNDCGCEWEETEETTKEIEIIKHGKETV